MNAATEAQFLAATETITEANFMGRALHTHAHKGDRGEILDREIYDGAELVTVLFERTGTVATVILGENAALV